MPQNATTPAVTETASSAAPSASATPAVAVAAASSNVRFIEGTTTSAPQLYACEWLPAADPPRALLFLVHGLHEHIGRYRLTAEYLASQHSIAVFGVDLPAHGHTTTDAAQRGLLPDIDPVAWAICRRVRDISQTRYHDAVPAFLFGHSLGSLIAFACLSRITMPADPAKDWSGPVRLAGFAVTGMCNPRPNGLLRLVVTVVRAVAPSLVVVPLSPDGLATKAGVREDYEHDPLNKISGVMAATAMAMTSCAAQNMAFAQSLLAAAESVPPMLFMHGDIDPLCPLSDAQALFNALPQALRDSGRAEMRIYHGKHEILNDTCGDEVREHLSAWINARLVNTTSTVVEVVPGAATATATTQ